MSQFSPIAAALNSFIHSLITALVGAALLGAALLWVWGI